ncbi:MAG TPA: DUF6493 family protein [Nocardioidaceae bacterium]|nr:DUF6493 family protein [Nocardioidaceae bacterium]
MTHVPSYDELRSLDVRHLNGLLHLADAAWQATYEHTWERDRRTWDAVIDALARRPSAEPEDAPPRWLEGLVARDLKEMGASSWAGGRFHRVRLLEQLGLVSPDHDDTYVLAFLGGWGGSDHQGRGLSKAQRLAQDPELRDELLWRLFEVEGGGEVSLANLDRFFPDGWQGTFRTLVDGGVIDRERVLTSCLEALQRDFNHYRAAWFSATYNAFEPTLDELERHQPHLRSILLSSLPASVAFSVRHLKVLAKAGLLDAAALPSLHSAVLVRTKGTALDVLRLAGGFSDEHRAVVLEIATSALGHESADVQRAASTLLTKLGSRSTVESEAAGMAASVRQSLGLPVPAPVPEAGTLEQPLEEPPPEVTPVDLLERTAALLEGSFGAGELEAVLAGLALHGTPELLQPLHKRAAAVAKRAAERDPRSLSGQLARLVLGDLGQDTARAGVDNIEQDLVLGRLAEVAEVVAGRRERRRLIATPDLPGWRLSRQAFLGRAGNGTPYPNDVAAALLRLDPGDRAELAAALPAVAGHPALVEPTPVRLHGELKTFTWTENGTERTGRYVDWDPGPRGDWSSGAWLPVLAATRPHDAERFLAMGIHALLDAANYPTVHHDIPVVLDTLACHPGHMGPLAALALALGLVAGRGDQRLHAADAFADLVPTGRVAAGHVADALARYADGWTISRAADSLQHAAQAPGVAPAVVEVLTSLVARLGPSYRGLAALLDVLHDQSLRLGVATTDPTLRAALEQITGSSKAARTARALLG